MFRKPRYAGLAQKFGFTVRAKDLFSLDSEGKTVPDADTFLTRVYKTIGKQASSSKIAADNLALYLRACQERAQKRKA